MKGKTFLGGGGGDKKTKVKPYGHIRTQVVLKLRTKIFHIGFLFHKSKQK